MQPQNKVIGANGCFFIDSEVAGKKFYMLIVGTDCVLTRLKGINGIDYIDKFGLSGKTLKAGVTITAANGGEFESIIPSSGDLMGYSD